MNIIYSDLNGFTPTQKPLLVNIESVYQSLFNIINTRPGERLFLPEFGIDLEDSVFEIIDDISAVDIFRIIVDAISRWEPRVTIDTSRTEVIPDEVNNAYEINLFFEITGIEDQIFEFRDSVEQ